MTGHMVTHPILTKVGHYGGVSMTGHMVGYSILTKTVPTNVSSYCTFSSLDFTSRLFCPEVNIFLVIQQCAMRIDGLFLFPMQKYSNWGVCCKIFNTGNFVQKYWSVPGSVILRCFFFKPIGAFSKVRASPLIGEVFRLKTQGS